MKDRATRMRIQYGPKDDVIQDAGWRAEFASNEDRNMTLPTAGSRLKFAIIDDAHELDPQESIRNARCGILTIEGRQEVQTPDFYAITSRGVVPHLTSDVLTKHASIGGAYMALEDFIEAAAKKAPPILTCPARGTPPSRLHSFSALPHHIPTIMAPRRVPAIAAPIGNSNTQILVYTSVGFQELSSKDYAMYASKLAPDIVVSMPDIPFGMAPGSKKKARMGDRTKTWLVTLISTLTSTPNCESRPAVFAPVLPLSYLDQKDYLEDITDQAGNEDQRESCRVEGLAFYDSSLLANMASNPALHALPRLSLDVPKNPHDVLRQISLGIDIFTLPFIGHATDAGLAFTFSLSPVRQVGHVDGQSPLQLARDMFSPTGAKDDGPLVPSCTCYACVEHHSAFITHLLAAKEMLGWVLLQIHNHHVISRFFTDVRIAIKAGEFENSRQSFERAYESDLPTGTAEKPRARGYHFKSEGPGETKKNKPAWGQLGGEADGPLVPDEAAGNLEDKGFGNIAS